MAKTYAIVLASGTGSRFGTETPKQFVAINGREVVEYTLDVCEAAAVVDEVVVVASRPYLDHVRGLIARNGYRKPMRVVVGGATRRESTVCGVSAVSDEEAKVLIHNAVQPFVKAETFADCVCALDDYEAVTVGSPCVYTVLQVDERRVLRQIVPRALSVNDLGPECFRLDFLRRVLASAEDDGSVTNLTGYVLRSGMGEVYVVDGDATNIKITYAEDVALAKKILAERRSGIRS